MKRIGIIAVFGAVVALALSSCSSTKSSLTDEIGSGGIGVVSTYSRDEYVILDKVSAVSNYVSYNSSKGEMEGDSLCYGHFNKTEKTVLPVVSKGGKKSSSAEVNPEEVARKNAYYILIQKVNDLGGDYILEPLEQVEKKVEKTGGKEKISYRVKVSALVIKIKRDR